jgi:hypothetical protein
MWLLVLMGAVLAWDPIRCVNFYGIETERKAPVCDWVHEPKWYLKKLVDGYGLNTVRLPYSREYVMANDFKTMDAIIQTCNEMKLKVILDYHRTFASHQGRTPTEGITLGQFLDTHLTVLQRYQDKIWGVSAFNEIQIKNAVYTDNVNHMIVNAVESQFPGKYVYFLGCANWGHFCEGVTIPRGLENRTFIDVHQYAFTNFTDITSFPSYIPASNFFIGETGATQQDMPWLRSFLQYLEKRGITNLCFWTIAHSSDTGGLWKDDCATMETEKMELLADFFNHTPPICRRRSSFRRIEF